MYHLYLAYHLRTVNIPFDIPLINTIKHVVYYTFSIP